MIYSTLMIATFQIGPNVKPYLISSSGSHLKRGGCEGLAVLASLFRRDPQFGSQCQPLLSNAPKYCHTKYIQRLNMREVYFREEYPRIMNVSFLQNISSSRASYLMSHLHKCKNTEAVFTSDYINILHTICFPTDCFRGTNFPLLDYLDNSPVSSHNLHVLLTNERGTFCKYLDADKMRGRVEKSI